MLKYFLLMYKNFRKGSFMVSGINFVGFKSTVATPAKQQNDEKSKRWTKVGTIAGGVCGLTSTPFVYNFHRNLPIKGKSKLAAVGLAALSALKATLSGLVIGLTADWIINRNKDAQKIKTLEEQLKNQNIDINV